MIVFNHKLPKTTTFNVSYESSLKYQRAYMTALPVPLIIFIIMVYSVSQCIRFSSDTNL